MKVFNNRCFLASVLGSGLLLLAGCGGSSGNNNGTTNTAPVANAGADQSVDDGATVTLDASTSSDSDGDTLSYAWTQTGGETVALSNDAAEQPTFTAPTVSGGTSLTFELTVSDGSESATDSVTITTNDITAPTASYSDTDTLDIHGALTVTFSEAINPDSLTLGGDLIDYSDGGVLSEGNTVLTISPDGYGAWESGSRTLTIDVADTLGNAGSNSASFPVMLDFSNFQAADVVIGQADFSGKAANQGGSASAETLNAPYGYVTFIGGFAWVPDTVNHRLLGFDGVPTANNASASRVVGQTTFTDTGFGTTDATLQFPQNLVEYNGSYYLADFWNNRVLVFDSDPYSAPRTASAVLGQATFTASGSACTALGMNTPEELFVVDGKLLVQDSSNNRVLIWNTVPTATGTAPDVVLGQADFTHCALNDDDQDGSNNPDPTARTLSYPAGIWSDGTRLVIVDSNTSRVLIWNSFPTSSFQPADIVLGQADFTHDQPNDDNQDGFIDAAPSARSLAYPYGGAWSNGVQLFVSDGGNHRVLVWNSFPTESFQAADAVLGQSSFTLKTANDTDQDGSGDGVPSENTLNSPVGVSVFRDKLLVIDNLNNRVLVFTSN